MWKQIGVEAELFNSEVRVHYNALRTQDFEVADTGWTADFDDAANFLFLLDSTSGQMNYPKYASPAYDALLRQSEFTLDPDKRSDFLRQAEQIMLDDVPVIPVVNDAYRRLVRSHVKGYEDNILKWNRTRYMRIENSRP
jgi:oligopeptide transport system substrate-binding protein